MHFLEIQLQTNTMKNLLIIPAIASLLFVSCESKSVEYEQLGVGSLSEASDSTSASMTSKQAFIRSASLQLKVNNVDSTVSKIESITKQFGGFAESSKLNRNVLQSFSKQISGDSVKITNVVLPQAELILRIPNNQLDVALTEFGKYATLVESREIACEDATAQLEANQLAIKRAKKVLDLTQKTKVETQLKYLENDKADLSAVEMLQLNQKVSYSTVRINLSQTETISTEVKADYDSTDFSRPSFGIELINALKNGFYLFRELILLIVKLWFFWVILFLGWISYKRIKAAFPRA